MTNSNNIKVLLFLAFFILNLSILFLVHTIDSKKHMDDLYSQIAIHQSDIQSIKLQVKSYEIRSNVLDNRLFKHENNELEYRDLEKNKLIDETPPVPKVKEAPKVEEPIDPETILLAKLINSESGNQSFEGKLAVGTVVMNRIESDDFPDTIKDVIYQKNQFSVVSNGSINDNPSEDSLKAAIQIMEGHRSLGADVLYFYNPELVSNTNWIVSRDIEKVIGDHAFAV